MEPSRRVGDYELLTELATGGVASVSVARHVGDAGFERLVAIKRVHRHLLRDPDVFASLADEARLSALVRHPNVVATHEVLDQKGELLLVQEYVEGVSLALLHKRVGARQDARLPVDAVARIAIDFLRGLHAAHEAVDMRGAPLGLVHRDVSPQNVLVGVDGVSRLIDFGVARAEGRIIETQGGILKGKLAYMAPEQVGERPVDRRADIFASGVVVWELLVGARPFDGIGEAESMARVLAAEIDLTAITARSADLAPIVARALARKPAARWATAEDLAEAIAEAVRPATDAVMRALVKDIAGELIEERRSAIREELGRAEEEALADDPFAAPEPIPLPKQAPLPAPMPAGDGVTPATRGATRWVVASVSAALLLATVAWLSGRDGGAPAPEPASASTPASTPTSREAALPIGTTERALPAAPISTHASSAGSSATTSSPASSRVPPPRASSPPASPASTALPVTPTAPSASARPDLHGNPYGP